MKKKKLKACKLLSQEYMYVHVYACMYVQMYIYLYVCVIIPYSIEYSNKHITLYVTAMSKIQTIQFRSKLRDLQQILHT